MVKYDTGDTIAAISTPIGEGGIAIVRLSGPDSLSIADKVFVSKNKIRPSKCRTYTTHYGHIIAGKKIIDEVILTVMKSPGSYTREDVIEINCHGGIRSAKKVLDLALQHACRPAEPGEFTKRAFLNGRIDLTQAEAVLEVIRAKTEGSLKIAMVQLEGALSREVDDLRRKAVDVAAEIEASIDFPDEGLEPSRKRTLIRKTGDIALGLNALADSCESGMIFREGVLIAICGKPNAGKSSLMNLLLKRDRVIVSPVPGTTRDAVEEFINLNGVPVRIADTAGISRTSDTVEKEGVKRSEKYLKAADIVILMLDNSVKLGRADLDIIKMAGDKKKIVVLNKIDLPEKADIVKIGKLFPKEKLIKISVMKKTNIRQLEKAVYNIIMSGKFIQGEGAIVTNARHKSLLDKALVNMLSVKKAIEKDEHPELVAVDIKEAILNLGLIVGKSVSGDILDRIFEMFCVGK